MLRASVIILALTTAASLVVNGRLFIYRHDQKWRRERGAMFGDWPLSHGWENIFRKADYAAEGWWLIPYAIALGVLSMLLLLVTFGLLARAV